jgi:Ricin-type beta-trefoil lectin domain
LPRFRKSALGLLAAFLAVGGILTSATAARASTVATCSAHGEFATCVAGGSTNNPITIDVTVTSSPDQPVFVAWDDTCSQGSGAGGDSGSFTASTPVTRAISHPYNQPANCIVSADAQLQNGGNSITVMITASSTPPPPKSVIHLIRGYDGKCVDDLADRSANGTKIVLWPCASDSAENWSFNGSHQLVHGSKCANDAGNAGNGGKIILYSCTRSQNGLWTHAANGEYVLKSHDGKLCLTDPGNATKNGTQLTVATCRNAADQHWTLP